MKRNLLIISFCLVLIGCGKGKDYCELPQPVNGFRPLAKSYDPNNPVAVELDFIFDFGQEIHETTTLFSFTVPDIFINPKGDRGVDVVDAPGYVYQLKDPTNAPDEVTIEGYAFNDCGKSDIASATIRFQ